jgi:hypothetical protein
MAVTDQSARLRALVAAGIEKQAFGQDFGYDVALSLSPSAHGLLITYTVVVTMPNPLLGQPALGQITLFTSPAPSEERVATAVTDMLAKLRKEASDVLSAGNGHKKTAGR